MCTKSEVQNYCGGHEMKRIIIYILAQDVAGTIRHDLAGNGHRIKMVGLKYDFLANPLGAVRSTFEKAVESGADPASFNGKDWGAIDLFRHFLADENGLSKVPVLNSTCIGRIQPNTLVRFQGMIQDMLGNEFYAGAYKDGLVWRTNKFMDMPQFPMGLSSDMIIWERRLLYCIPVPGLNSWTEFSSEAVMDECEDLTSQHGEKHRRIDDQASNHMDMLVSDDGCQGSPSTKKMRKDEYVSPSSQSQKPITEGSCFSRSVVADVGKVSLPCLVKVYDSPESELKLNDVFEFVGVFVHESEHCANMDDQDEFSTDVPDEMLVHLPSSTVPRLHCFIHRKLVVHDFLRCSPTMEPKPHFLKEIRNALLGYLTAILGNDGLAANLILLHLLSTVHARVDNVAVGKLSINLTCFSKESSTVFGSRLGLALKNLLPFTHSIPLTVGYLNTASLAPKKDYQTNRLITGVLQLAEGSHLLVDETQLETGTLNSVGVENARLLKILLELQKVDYDFQYYKMEMPANVQVLVLSEGKSNILPADLIVPFQPSSVCSYEVLTAEAVEALRWYLATIRSFPHSIDLEMQKVVENDLVEARQADRNLGSQDFSRLLTMARLMTMSFGESSLSMEYWQMVKELERLRRERLK